MVNSIVSSETLHSMGFTDFSGNSMRTERDRTCSPGLGNVGDDTESSEPNEITVSFS